MIKIHLINGNSIVLPAAHYTESLHNGSMDYYTDKTKTKWVGRLTRRGDFVDPGNSTVQIHRNKGETIEDLVNRLEEKDNFTYRENELIMKIKKLLTCYLPKSGRYK